MKRLLLLAALAASACGREAPEDTAVTAPAAADAVLPGEDSANRSAGVVPMPKEEAQVDRMILAGYTPHGDHLHPPGVKECPLSMGSEVVM